MIPAGLRGRARGPPPPGPASCCVGAFGPQRFEFLPAFVVDAAFPSRPWARAGLPARSGFSVFERWEDDQENHAS